MFPILVKDRDGNVIESTEWLLAKGLVRYNYAEPLFQLPATIQLSCDTDTYQKLKTKRLNFKYFKPKIFYGSILFRSFDEQDMFRSDSVKTLWYLSRNLVTPVSQDPPIVKFNKKTNGMGHCGDQFYLNIKNDTCVVCGSTKKLTRHHIMPHMFRKYMPENIKGRSYHDIVLLCVGCHREYEKQADVLKSELYLKYKVPQDKTPNKFLLNNETNHARGLARAIIEHGLKMSPQSLSSLKKKFEETTGLLANEDVLHTLCQEQSKKDDNPDYVDLGKWVVDRIEDFQEFAVLWRKHFLDSMKPEHMPEFWSENRPVFRT